MEMLLFRMLRLFFCFAATLLVSSAANAACDSYQQLRVDRIIADLSQYTPPVTPRPTIVIGDSDTFNFLYVYPAGTTMNGRRVVFAAVSGASYQTIDDCFSTVQSTGKTVWQHIVDTQPEGIAIWLGINDAVISAAYPNAPCCDANGNATSAYVLKMMNVLRTASAITPNIVIATSPAPDITGYAAGVDAYRFHQVLRTEHYLVDGCDTGNPCSWALWGGSPAAGIGKRPFVDLYTGTAQAPCNAPVLPWNGTGCLAPPLRTVDQTHLNHDDMVAAFNAIAAVMP